MHHERHPRRTKVTTTARMHQATNRSPAPHSRGRPPRSRPAPPLPPRAEPTTWATNARRSTPTAYRIDRSGTHAPRSGTGPARCPDQTGDHGTGTTGGEPAPRAEPTTWATNAPRNGPTAYRIDQNGTHEPRHAAAVRW